MLVTPRDRNLAALLDTAALRARIHAENIAHQNTPGYRARAVRFEEAFREALNRGDMAGAAQVRPEVYEPRSTMVNNDGNDVSVDREVTLASQNAVLYNAYVAILRGRKTLMDTAIGRGGA